MTANGENEISVATEAVEIVTAQFVLFDNAIIEWHGPKQTIVEFLQTLEEAGSSLVEFPKSEYMAAGATAFVHGSFVQAVTIIRHKERA